MITLCYALMVKKNLYRRNNFVLLSLVSEISVVQKNIKLELSQNLSKILIKCQKQHQ